MCHLLRSELRTLSKGVEVARVGKLCDLIGNFFQAVNTPDAPWAMPRGLPHNPAARKKIEELF